MDVAIGFLLLIGLYRGLKNGLFVELAAVVFLFLGVYLALTFSYVLRSFLEGWLSWNPKIIQIAAFVGTLLLVGVGVHWLARILSQITRLAALGWLTKLAGGVFGMLKILLLIGLFLHLVQRINHNNVLFSKDLQEKSVFYGPVLSITTFLMPKIVRWTEDVTTRYPSTTSTP